MKEKQKKKWWQVLLIVLGCVVVFFGAVLLGGRAYFRWSVNDYYKCSEKTFLIPGTNSGFVAQGLEYDEDNALFLVTGYMNNKTASPLYVVGKNDNQLKKSLKLLDQNGEEYKGHAGGLALGNGKLYIANDTGLLVYDYQDVLDATDGQKLTAIGNFSTKVFNNDYIGVAFVTVSENQLIVGEFYRAKNYETLQSHRITTKAGDRNTAVAVVYNLDGSTLGVNATPVKAYSLPGLVQGMAINDGKIYLSTSWGLGFSNIYVYDQSKLVKESDNYQILGATVPLYSLDSESLVISKKIAPMSEEIVIVDGKMYTMCESASNKYIFGKFTSSQWCYATNVDEFFK